MRQPIETVVAPRIAIDPATTLPDPPPDVAAELATLTAAVDVLLDPKATAAQKAERRSAIRELRDGRERPERDGR